MDRCILILELDLTATILDAGVGLALAALTLHEFVAPVVPTQGQVARGNGAGIECW